MPPLTIALLCAALVLALWFLAGFCWRAASWPKTVVKTASVALLAGAGAVAGVPGLLVGALALGAVGDYALSRPGARAFLAGLVAFALAHLAYVALLAGQGWRWPQPWAVAGLGLFAGVMAARLWPRAGALRGPVMIYVAIIAAMGVAAFGTGQPRLIVPALLFIASDAVLSAEMFLLGDGHRARRVTPFAIWSTYWLAQAGFLAAFL